MAFTRNWSEGTPSGTEEAKLADDYIRYLKVNISDRLKNMIYGFITGENTLSQHFQYIQFYEQASISQPSAGYGRLGCKAVGGKCEMFWHDEDGDEIQLTSGGKFMIGYGTASQALMWNTTEEDGENGRESQIRAKGEQSGGEVTTLGYLEFSHDGTSDDQKGRFRIVLNDGDDDDAPSKVAIVFQADGAIDVGDSVSVLDEDDFSSDSATKLVVEQAIKAYVDLDSTGSVMHDAEGGYDNVDVGGTKTKVYTKYLTGTLDADDSTSVAHGCTASKILSVSAILYNDQLSQYVANTSRITVTSTYAFAVRFDATNIIISSVGEYLQGNVYRIKIDYYL